MNQSFISWILIITLFSSLSVSNAWTLPGRGGAGAMRAEGLKRFPKSLPKSIQRHFRNGVEDDASSTIQFGDGSGAMHIWDATTTAMPTVVSTSTSPALSSDEQQPLRTIDLPKHSPSNVTIQNAKMLWDLELVLGRTAMVAGVLMLLGEIVFGISPLIGM